MKKNLVIVESPAKAKTLEKFLGGDFEVKACGGHVRDLPRKKLGVDVSKNFEPTYVALKDRAKIIESLKKATEKKTHIYLAPDPDREGEAIAWHLKYLLGKDGRVKRIEFNEITKEAVLTAIKHPREIDMARVNAQQARRILDRLVGYKLSPLLWKKVRKGLSAGRVQSVAVRLICEREAEIKKFKPQEYWQITAHLSTEEKETFQAKLGKRPNEKGKVIKSKAEADKILQDLKGAAFVVSQIEKKTARRNPAPPFITSTLQQEASRKLGFSTKKTMFIAQKLYEGIDLEGEGRVGLITYMRTDSVRIAHEAEGEVRKYIAKTFGAEYLPPYALKYKRKKQSQDAHEAIRPTSSWRHPEKVKESLRADELKLYDIIWKRFVACQMNPAIFDQTSIEISAKDYLFGASGSVLKFDGFSKLYREDKEEQEEMLPELEKGETLKLLELLPTQHFTEPPPRYTEASLVKELEQKGIGRPSTYAPIISTIQERGYIIREDKKLKPAEIGMVTNEQLVRHFPKILDIKFTAQMEDELDEVVVGKLEWTEALQEFYQPFAKSLAEAEKKMEKVKKEVKTQEICPKCGKNLVIRSGRYGDFMACSGYPNCKFTKNLPQEEKEALQGQEICEKCKSPMTLKHSRYGDFLACSAYPKCKNIKPILKKIEAKCPKCKSNLAERRTKRGKLFYGCSRYPKCDFATWQKPKGDKNA